MSDSIQSLVAQIHASRAQISLVLTGGGSLAIGDLLTVPGGSRTVLECTAPYAATALAAYLGRAPDHYCSEATARAMAMVAFVRGGALGGEWSRRVGVSLTASLASDRPKRGEHRLHMACQTGAATVATSLVLAKGRRTRAEEERLAATLVVNQIAEAAGLATRAPLELMHDETLLTERFDAPPAWQALWSGHVDKLAAQGASGDAAAVDSSRQRHSSRQRQLSGAAQGASGAAAAAPRLIFSGAFNPRHAGHSRMADVAAALLGAPVAWELTIKNAEKPPLDYLEVSRRLGQFAARETVYLTRAATFIAKAELFPGTTFIVGVDTLERIDQPRFYGAGEAARDAAMAGIAARGCKFLVFGRLMKHGADASEAEFRTLSQLPVSPALRAICIDEVTAERFRADVSSTELRTAK